MADQPPEFRTTKRISDQPGYQPPLLIAKIKDHLNQEFILLSFTLKEGTGDLPDYYMLECVDASTGERFKFATGHENIKPVFDALPPDSCPMNIEFFTLGKAYFIR